MSTSIFENKAFQKAPSSVGFNLVHQVNNFNTVFQTKPLDLKEASEIERLLIDNFQPDKITEAQAVRDAEQLKLITVEIKAIGKQGTVLMGERVHRAKELLKPYKDGTFTKWLESTFGTRKTGYNMLAYYELYTALPHEELRERLKKLPQRTAYILASRNGAIDTKAEIISEYHDKTHDEMVLLIKEKLPIASGDKRAAKNTNNRLIATMKDAFQQLRKNESALTDENRKDLLRLAEGMIVMNNV